jgi:serine/threonine protein kinase/tetratricopeptide (TPR) repeat protein
MTSGRDDKTSARILPSGTPGFRYRIVEKVGAGGMGEVHLAEDTSLHRRVALKFLPAHLAADADLRARFQREAQAAARLDHPAIVTIHEVGELDGRPYIAMQFVEGRALSHYCRDEPLPIAGIARLVAQVCEGLAAAHAAGVTHRDIKPANILVDREMRPKILDFGLASVRGSEDLTRTGSTLGTVAYMSPEQAQGQPAGYRSDLFSVGVVLYELVAGRTPFRRESEAATLRAIVSEEPEPLARYKADVPGELQRIVGKCLAKRADERYQSAADLAADLRVLERLGAHGGAGAPPSIAVLPFTNMSPDPENEYFSDGLTEELLNVLAKNPELKVTGRTSSFAFKGKQEDVRLIGQKLGVGVLLEGSVRKAGNRVRITAQLVNVADGFHLWSETYDRVLDDIFALQDDIARAVAGALNVTLLGKGRRKVNAEAYALVLRAQQSARLMTGPGLDLAIQLYRKALELDPDYAPAWAGAARSYAMQSAWGHGDDEAARQARECIDRALELDDELAETYETLGFILVALELRIGESREARRKAVQLAPNSSRAVASLAVQVGLLGRFEEALRLVRRAVELDPLDPGMHIQLGRILHWAHQPEEARAALLRGLQLSPGVTGAHGWVSETWLMQGGLDEALAEALQEEVPGYRDCGLAIVFHARGEKEEADRALERLLTYGNRWAMQVACVYAFRNERDKAFEWLRRALELRDSGIPVTRVQPMLENLHDDPRWWPFLEEIGLADEREAE